MADILSPARNHIQPNNAADEVEFHREAVANYYRLGSRATIGEYQPKENNMTDLISRAELLKYLRKERDDYFRENFFQDPATGTYEASNAVEEYLEYLDERIDLIDNFPPVKPIATLVNNNQVGNLNIIETAPNVTIDIGTKLYAAREQIVGHLGAALMQSLPSDDQIIMGHVKEAYDLAVTLPR